MKKLVYILFFISYASSAQKFPQPIDIDNQIIYHDGFILSYNERCEQPNWVYYKMLPSDFGGEKIKRKNRFREDTSVSTGSASLKDYKYTGYDRGHLKPSGDEPTDAVQNDETFLLSNISPQDPSFNRGIWLRLENYVRKQMDNSDSIIVITGGNMHKTENSIGDNDVCVSSYFYKVLYIYKNDKMIKEYFYLPNKKSDENIQIYRINKIKLEKEVKLKFD